MVVSNILYFHPYLNIALAVDVSYNPIFWSKKKHKNFDQLEKPSMNIISKEKNHWRQIDRHKQDKTNYNNFEIGFRVKCHENAESALKVPWKRHESAMNLHQSAVWWQIHGTLMALSTKQSSKQCRFMAFSWHFTLETIFSSFDRWSKSTTNSKRNIPIVLPLIQKYGWLTYPLIWVVVSNIFYFHPLPGGMIQFD